MAHLPSVEILIRASIKTPANKPRNGPEMSAEYKSDYEKARPNRFASRMKDGPLAAELDPDFVTLPAVRKLVASA